MLKSLPALLCALLCLGSCQLVNNLIHDDQVVARVGADKLYRSEVDACIPKGVTPEDSTNLALQYINSWATGILFGNLAESHLSKDQLDVSAELEDYRRALLKYRYEQLYISSRLDTVVTDTDIQEYYDAHQDMFVLKRPILKVRYLDIMKNAERRDDIVHLMASSKPDDIVEASELAFYSALRYFDSSDTWLDAMTLAQEFGTDYGTMLSHLSGGYITYDSPDKGDVKIAWVADIRRSGVAPVEFCTETIRDYILSARKHVLLDNLERELLTKALDRKNLVIY